MWVQAVGIALIVTSSRLRRLSRSAPSLLGLGTAMVYPTLLAAIGDVAHPTLAGVGGRRVPALARPRLRRSARSLAGITADAFGLAAAIWRRGRR